MVQDDPPSLHCRLVASLLGLYDSFEEELDGVWGGGGGGVVVRVSGSVLERRAGSE